MKQIGLAMHNYHQTNGAFPMGAIRQQPVLPGNGWGPYSSMLQWTALILPYLEGGNTYNAINLGLGAGYNGVDNGEFYTAYLAVPNTFVCPSDGKNGSPPGFMPMDSQNEPAYGGAALANPHGQAPAYGPPLNPSTGQFVTVVPVTNYAFSWGDNCAGCGVGSNLPWEHVPGAPIPPGGWRIGWPGYWGTNVSDGFDSGQLRGYADYMTGQFGSINDTTDGTSNTVLVGEVLPNADANNNFWTTTGAASGTTIPLGWNTESYDPTLPDCRSKWQGPTPVPPLGCRYSAAAKGFVSRHPGGANLLFADGSVHFLKNTISLITFTALGSRNGGEVVSAGSY
jgi:prepilin-type processing-associated H-X9-DG protein